MPQLSVGEPGTGNLLVEGDNLLALKGLLPYYAGQVKCIYIDPPYNTGNENWIYNDNVNRERHGLDDHAIAYLVDFETDYGGWSVIKSLDQSLSRHVGKLLIFS